MPAWSCGKNPCLVTAEDKYYLPIPFLSRNAADPSEKAGAMAKYTQSGQPLSHQHSPWRDALLLEKLAGSEGISELFRFQLELLAETPVAFDKLLGQPATLTLNLPNRSGRQIHGIIASATKGRRARDPEGSATLLRYRANSCPPPGS